MRTITPLLAAVMLSLPGGAGAMTQSPATGPLINIDSARAVNACIPVAERNRPMAEIGPARRRQMVACIFANTSRQANAQLPRQVDDVTRLDRITSSGATLT